MTTDEEHGIAHEAGHEEGHEAGHDAGHDAGHAGPAGHAAQPDRSAFQWSMEADADLEPGFLPDQPRTISMDDRLRYEGYLAEILTALGLDLDTPGTRPTPRRLLQALFDTTSGYEGDPKLLTAFPTECRGGANCEIAQVVEGPIPFFALCEHHALPFFGNVYVGYVAHEGIIGISKLTRLVHVVTRRFGVQERMTYQIADELDRMMAPHGVAVYAEAHHLCTQMRGVRELHPKTRTTSYRGVYVESAQMRGEFFDVSGLRRAES